jgi:type IV pilus assembly protein PilW
MSHLPQIDSGSKGFTLVELMIALLVSSVVAGAIYFVYTGQQKIYTLQEAVVDMQQNLRAGLYLVGQELRMAGYDPQGSAGAGIVNATSNGINFTQDITDNAGTGTDGDGDVADANENITLAFNPATLQLTRNTGGGAQPFVDNVDFIEFVYTLEDGTVTSNPNPSTLDQIRTIQVSMLVRAASPEINFLNTFTYTTPFGTVVNGGPYNDNFQRRFLYTTVQCRNIGL